MYQDGPDGPHLGRFCGSSLPSNLTAATRLWVKLNIAAGGEGGSFVAEYRLQHGGELEGWSGELASPLYPLHLHSQSFSYHWTITSPPGTRVEISFIGQHFLCFGLQGTKYFQTLIWSTATTVTTTALQSSTGSGGS